jgi:hypothetical protein
VTSRRIASKGGSMPAAEVVSAACKCLPTKRALPGITMPQLRAAATEVLGIKLPSSLTKEGMIRSIQEANSRMHGARHVCHDACLCFPGHASMPFSARTRLLPCIIELGKARYSSDKCAYFEVLYCARRC